MYFNFGERAQEFDHLSSFIISDPQRNFPTTFCPTVTTRTECLLLVVLTGVHVHTIYSELTSDTSILVLSESITSKVVKTHEGTDT